ncbi:hypothetical protein D3C75_768140 [compost metagenome]
MRTETVNVYKFDELSEKAKEKARQWYRQAGESDQWWDGVFEDVRDIAKLMGVEIERIGFSGFSCQGDGAHFVGSFKYAPGAAKAVAGYAPKDEAVQRIAKEWQALQAANFYKLTGTVKHSGHYQHENCTVFEVKRLDTWASSDVEDAVEEVMRDFMRYIYRRLEKEYDWLNEDSQVDASILGNEYEFKANGEFYK